MAFSFAYILEDNTGRIIISIILGLGLASLFKKVCHGRNCIIIKGPQTQENWIIKYINMKTNVINTKQNKQNVLKIILK